MTDAHGTAVDIDDVIGYPEILDTGHCLSCEGFVYLPKINVGHRKSCLLYRL